MTFSQEVSERYVDPQWIARLKEVDPTFELVHVVDDSWMVGSMKPRWMMPDNGVTERRRGNELMASLQRNGLRLRKTWVMARCYQENFQIIKQINCRGEPPIGELVKDLQAADWMWKYANRDFEKELDEGQHDLMKRNPALLDRVAYEGRAAFDYFLRGNRKIAVNGLNKERAA